MNTKGNQRASAAPGAAAAKRWHVRVAVDTHTLAARGSPFSLLRELLGGPRTALLIGLATGAHLFNALDQLSRLCLHERIWTAVVKPSAVGVKQLVVYVPPFASGENIASQIKRLAASMQLDIALNAVDCENVPPFVIDALVASMLTGQLEAAGCTIVGEASERQVVLSSNMFVGDVPTISMPQLAWHFDQSRQQCILELTCIPLVMKLKTIAEDAEISGEDDEVDETSGWTNSSRVRVLPRLSNGWVVSRLTEEPFPAPSARNEAPHIPRTSDDFRRYWLQVHGIRMFQDLPQDFGGFVRVRFSSTSIFTYPACCVSTQWTPLHKQTRLEGLDIIRGFASIVRQMYGEENVSISNPDDQVEKSAVLLPASALVNDTTTRSNGLLVAPGQLQQPRKRRMIHRDCYMAS